MDGKILGEHANKFLPNLPLTETNVLKSNVLFKNIEIEGSVLLSGDLNGDNFEEKLKDIVYKVFENDYFTGRHCQIFRMKRRL